MNTQTELNNDGIRQLAEDARALLAATSEVAGDKVGEARRRLAAALENSEALYGRVRAQAAEGAKLADQTVREHPYQAVGIALGVGAIFGYLLTHRCCRNGA